MLKNKPNQPSTFKTKNWAEIKDERRGTYKTNSDAHIPIKWTIKIIGAEWAWNEDVRQYTRSNI